jgi:hypothetical protein
MRSPSVERLTWSSAAACDLLPWLVSSAHRIKLASTSRRRSSSEMLVPAGRSGVWTTVGSGVSGRHGTGCSLPRSRSAPSHMCSLRDALASIFELAHVAGPRVLCKGLRHGRRDGRRRLSATAKEALDKRLHQVRDVLPPVAKRGERQRQHVETVVQVLTEFPVRDHLLEVTLATRENTDVDRHQPDAPQALHSSILQYAKQLHLHTQRHVVDVVEEDRATSAISKRPGRSLIAPVKAPRSCPNSSDSIRVSENRAQLTAMNGRCFRRLVS